MIHVYFLLERMTNLCRIHENDMSTISNDEFERSYIDKIRQYIDTIKKTIYR